MGWAVYDDAFPGSLKPIDWFDLNTPVGDAAAYMTEPPVGVTWVALDTLTTVFHPNTHCVDITGSPAIVARPTFAVDTTITALGSVEVVVPSVPIGTNVLFGSKRYVFTTIDDIKVKSSKDGKAIIQIEPLFPYQQYEGEVVFGAGGTEYFKARSDVSNIFRMGEKKVKLNLSPGFFFKPIGDLPPGAVWADAGTVLDRDDYAEVFAALTSQAKGTATNGSITITAIDTNLTAIFTTAGDIIEIGGTLDSGSATAHTMASMTSTTIDLISAYSGATGTKFLRLIPAEIYNGNLTTFKIPEDAGWAIYTGELAASADQRHVFLGGPRIIQDSFGGWFQRLRRYGLSSNRLGLRLAVAQDGGNSQFDALDISLRTDGTDVPVIRKGNTGTSDPLAFHDALIFNKLGRVEFGTLARLRKYTVDEVLALLTPEEQSITYISNPFSGKPKLIIFDGTNWRWPDWTQAYSAEQVLNGDFASGADWSLEADWSIAAGVATKIAGAAVRDISQTYAFVNSASYRATFTITAITVAGTFTFRLKGGTTFGLTSRSAPGTYTEDFVVTGNTSFAIRGSAAIAGSIDDVSIVRLM